MATSKKAAGKRSSLPDWDTDSPRLHANLAAVFASMRSSATRRNVLAVEDAREWYKTMMRGLDAGKPIYVGRFRGEP